VSDKAKRGRDGHRVYTGADDGAVDGRLCSLQQAAYGALGCPAGAAVPTDSFLSLIEDAGLIRPLTHTVLGQALDQAVRWHAQGRPLTVAVKVAGGSVLR
jgi:predicted signal transduction protein with EAL and GGDEF domain